LQPAKDYTIKRLQKFGRSLVLLLANLPELKILARRFSQEVIDDGAGKSRDELFPASAGGFLLREKPVQQTYFARRLFTIFLGLGILFFTIFVMVISS
jgi:hypothetical protein